MSRRTPEQARKLIERLCGHMRRRVWELESSGAVDVERDGGQSAQKQYYGDAWTLIYGISVGMHKMGAENDSYIDPTSMERVDNGISGDSEWQQHYDEYGYGAYGRGLEIGKRLAFFEDRGFDISDSPSTDAMENANESPEFTIRSYDGEQ